MKRQKLIILPQLNECSGDLTKKWFVFYSVLNPKTGKLERFKIFDGFGKLNTITERYQHAEQIIREYTEKLKCGWSPFKDDKKVIYMDNLQYEKVARIYGKQRASNLDIRYYASKYLDYITPSIDYEGTLPTYQSKIRIFVMWCDTHGMKDNDATCISNNTMVSFFNWLINDQKRSGKTVSTYRQVLQSFFEWMVKEKVFIANPVHDLPKCNRINDQSPSPIHFNDIAEFKNAMSENPQLWLAVQFQYYCAIRPGKELRYLKIKQIDFARGLVTVNRMEAKKRITRTVVIPDNFLFELRNNYKLHEYHKELYVISKDGKPGPNPIGKNTLRRHFNAIRTSLGMPLEYKLYSWKHTGAVQSSLSGIPDKHIQMQLGHTSLETTSRYLRKMVGFQSDFLKNKYPGI